MATIPLVVRVDNLDARTTTQFAFLKSPVRIGRSELNDLPLMEPFVSQWHGVIQFDDNQITYVDLGSTNGTQCDGVRLGKNVPVEVGPTTELRVGSLRLMLSRRAMTQRPVAPRPPTQFALHASASGLGHPQAGEQPAAAPVEPVLPFEPSQPSELAQPGELIQPSEPVAPYQPEPYVPPVPEVDLAEQAVNNAGEQLGAEYAAYHESWQRLQDSMQALVSSLDEGIRDRAVGLLRERYPGLGAQDGGGQQLAAPVAAAEPVNGLGATALKLVQAFAESYLPMGQPISTPQALESFLGRIAELIESYSKSFVELRKGYNEFGKEMGIRTVHGDTPIHRARDHRQVLAYLLEGRDDGQRIQDLQAAFADIMIHHVALLNGIMEGAREMLGRLSPDEIVSETVRQPAKPWPPSAWPVGKGRFWNTYVMRHREIADEESSISQVLFGKEFARAYSAVVGQRGTAEPEEPTSRKAPPRASAGPRTSHGR